MELSTMISWALTNYGAFVALLSIAFYAFRYHLTVNKMSKDINDLKENSVKAGELEELSKEVCKSNTELKIQMSILLETSIDTYNVI